MHDERIARLVGNGKNDASGGGGILLPDAFRAVLQTLLDGGMTPLGTISRKVAEGLGVHKEPRVIAVWGSWENLTLDLLEQLKFKGLVRQGAMPLTDEMWELAEGFRQHPHRYAVIDENAEAGIPRIRVSVQTAASENTRNHLSRAVLEINSLKTTLSRENILTPSMNAAFTRLVTLMSAAANPQSVIPAVSPPVWRVPPPVPGDSRYGTIGTDDEPPDRPDVKFTCKRCGIPKPWTRENFEVYKDKSKGKRGLWYWRPQCVVCRKEAMEERIRSQQAELVQVLATMIEDGTELTIDNATARMTSTTERNKVRLVWGRAWRAGQAPPCPRKPRRSGMY